MTEHDKTLVILSPGFPKDESDSTCIPPQQVFVRNLKLQFPRLNIIVLAFEYPYEAAQYQWNGITVISFAGANKGGPARLNSWRRAWLTLVRLNKTYQLLGLLSFWMGDCAFLADAFAKRKKLKNFCWILGQDAKSGNRYFRWINPRANSLIALSDFISKEVKKNYALTPAHIIPVGVDPFLFPAMSQKRGIDILAAGSLIPLKLYSLLINMISTLRDEYPHIRAVICGEGPERQLLSKLIKDYQLEENIELTGELPHVSVLALMQRSRIFAHPSSYEGLGMVCLEALYAGAQVVSFVRPIDEQVKNWHIAGSPDEMVAMIKSILKKVSGHHTRVAPFLIADTCKDVIGLFDYKDPAIS